MQFFWGSAIFATAGCTTLDLRSAQNVLDAPLEKVVERRATVALPITKSYRNFLTKARECWQQSTGILSTESSTLEIDPFDDSVGYARVTVRMSGMVHAIVTMSPVDETTTLLVARQARLAGSASMWTEKDWPFVGQWAAGIHVACRFRFFL